MLKSLIKEFIKTDSKYTATKNHKKVPIKKRRKVKAIGYGVFLIKVFIPILFALLVVWYSISHISEILQVSPPELQQYEQIFEKNTKDLERRMTNE